MQKTKIICTLGPSCQDYKTICRMIKAGMNVARLNMSHGELSYHQQLIETVKQARQDLNKPCAIMVDTRGPEVRIDTFKDGKVMLKKGQTFVFTKRDVEGDNTQVGLRFPKLVDIAKVGKHIYANNGLLKLKIVEVSDTDITCKVVVGGELSNNKSIAIPHVPLEVPYINDVDREHIKFAVDNQVEAIACSFVNCKEDILAVRKLVEEFGGNQEIISKIESLEGIKLLDEIIDVSDGIMVARGDMGTEIPLEKIPFVQKEMIKKTVQKGKYVIVATEMLESMIQKRRPTRAETTDVANAIYDGTSATMLSGETASGAYPVEAIQTMAAIAKSSEQSIKYDKRFTKGEVNTMRDAISYSACSTSFALKAKAILCFSHMGNSAKAISCYRPDCKIVVLTTEQDVYHKLSFCWGAIPVVCPPIPTTDDMIKKANDIAKELKVAKPGDTIIITSGIPVDKMGKTNLIKIHIVE